MDLPGGAFEQWFSESWTSGLAENTLQRRVEKNTNALTWAEKLPLSSYPVLEPGAGEGLVPYFLEWLQHPTYDDYWKTWSIEDHFSQIQVPGYHVGGWYDIFMGGTLRNYAGIKARSGSVDARRGQRLLIGPWYHGPFTGKTGDVDFGSEANVEKTSDDIILRWYDYLLKGIQNGVEKEKPVKIFVMGKISGAKKMIGRWPERKARVSTCIRLARQTPLQAMERLAALHLRSKLETVLYTIPQIPYLRVEEAFAATTIIWLRAHSISVLTKIEMMYWSTPRPSFTTTWRSRDRSRSSFMPAHPPWTRTSRPSSSMFGRTDSPRI